MNHLEICLARVTPLNHSNRNVAEPRQSNLIVIVTGNTAVHSSNQHLNFPKVYSAAAKIQRQATILRTRETKHQPIHGEWRSIYVSDTCVSSPSNAWMKEPRKRKNRQTPYVIMDHDITVSCSLYLISIITLHKIDHVVFQTSIRSRIGKTRSISLSLYKLSYQNHHKPKDLPCKVLFWLPNPSFPPRLRKLHRQLLPHPTNFFDPLFSPHKSNKTNPSVPNLPPPPPIEPSNIYLPRIRRRWSVHSHPGRSPLAAWQNPRVSRARSTNQLARWLKLHSHRLALLARHDGGWFCWWTRRCCELSSSGRAVACRNFQPHWWVNRSIRLRPPGYTWRSCRCRCVRGAADCCHWSRRSVG